MRTSFSFKFLGEASSLPSQRKPRETEQDWDTDTRRRALRRRSHPYRLLPLSTFGRGRQLRCPARGSRADSDTTTFPPPAVLGQSLWMSNPKTGREGAGNTHLPERRLPRCKAKLEKQVSTTQPRRYHLFFRRHTTK